MTPDFKKLEENKASVLVFRRESIDLSIFEKEYDVVLPPIFKSFLQNFESIAGEFYADENNEIHSLAYYRYYAQLLDGEDLFLQGFSSIPEIWNRINGEDFWSEMEVLPISNHDHGGVIVVGLGEHNMG